MEDTTCVDCLLDLMIEELYIRLAEYGSSDFNESHC